MTKFVDECRDEWKRLGVSKRVADEMAAELEADLEEGASAEDVLGAAVVDARSFAREWAAQRGVTSRSNRSVVRAIAAAAVTLVAAAIAGAVLLISSPSARATVLSPADAVWLHAGTQRVWAGPPLHAVTVPVNAVQQPAGLQMIKTEVSRTSMGTHTAGLVLLSVGLGGLVPTALLWSSTRRGLDVALDR